MAATIDVLAHPLVNLEAIQQWVREHGHAPEDIRPTVTINDDGTVVLERMVRKANGDIEIAGDEIVTTAVVVEPRRPFPLDGVD